VQGFRDALQRGILTGNPVSGCKFILEDGAAHQVDSSELAFRLAAQGAFREAFPLGRPTVLEPIMSVEIVAPIEFQGASLGPPLRCCGLPLLGFAPPPFPF